MLYNRFQENKKFRYKQIQLFITNIVMNKFLNCYTKEKSSMEFN